MALPAQGQAWPPAEWAPAFGQYRLNDALYSGDVDGLRRAAHTLKSNAATFGATALEELCRELEAIGEAGAVAGATEVLARADAEHERVRSDLHVQVR